MLREKISGKVTFRMERSGRRRLMQIFRNSARLDCSKHSAYPPRRAWGV